jgi:hypothetical protein
MAGSTGPVQLSGPQPYLAAGGVRPGAPAGTLAGRAKASNATATFVAYLSTEVGRQGSGSCPSASGQDGAIEISAPVTVTWGAAPPILGNGPIVTLTCSAGYYTSCAVPTNVPVTITASYLASPSLFQGADPLRALYIVDDGVFPPNFNYMYGTLDQIVNGVDPPPAHMPYVAAHPVPTFPDAAAVLTSPNDEAVNFGAFLSTLDGLQAGPTFKNGAQTTTLAPFGDVGADPTFGTTAADFSPVVPVSWGSGASSSGTIRLQASATTAKAGQQVTFTATASNLPAGYTLYVCGLPGGSGPLTTEDSGSGQDFVAKSAQPVASGWASGDGANADFIAFSSPDPNWGWCSGVFPGPYPYYVPPPVSNVVSVTWSGKKQVRWYPS